MRNETFLPDPCSFDAVKIRLKMNAESVPETLDAILSILLKNYEKCVPTISFELSFGNRI